MTTEELMTIARACASTGALPKAKVLRQFMAALVGAADGTAPAPEHVNGAASEHVEDADDAELAQLRAQVARLQRELDAANDALAQTSKHVTDAFAAASDAVLHSVLGEAAAHLKRDPAALLGLANFAGCVPPALVERTMSGNVSVVGMPLQMTPDEAMTLARDLARASEVS